MSNTKYYICEKCGNLVEVVNASGVPMVCCGQKMTYLEPGTGTILRTGHRASGQLPCDECICKLLC